ncbi:hypothetical protein ACHQM5_025410 [Ranunculus cassubicifolius]
MSEPTSSNPFTLELPPLEYLSPAHSHAAREEQPIEAPTDILELLRQHVEWKTVEDLFRLHAMYALLYPHFPNLDREREMDKLKRLSFALENALNDSMRKYEEIERTYEDVFHELVKQVAHIKDMPDYEHLTTEYENFEIDIALQEIWQKVKMQKIDDSALAIILEELHNKLMSIHDEREKLALRIGSINSLLGWIKRFMKLRFFCS